MAAGARPLDNVVLVLVQPQDLVNVAAIVRVMSNFGLSRLRLVEPAAFDPWRILGIAHHTEPIIEQVERYPDLPGALADCSLVLGTTGRPRETRRERLTPRQAAPLVLQAAGQNPGSPVAILFGRETDGLTNAELDGCHLLVTIPTAENRSLNLAQAGLVLSYELWLAAAEPAPQATPAALAADGEPLATGRHREEMFAALERLLHALYPATTEQRMARSMQRLRAVLLRAAPRSGEARMLSHLFQHLARAVGRKESGS